MTIQFSLLKNLKKSQNLLKKIIISEYQEYQEYQESHQKQTEKSQKESQQTHQKQTEKSQKEYQESHQKQTEKSQENNNLSIFYSKTRKKKGKGIKLILKLKIQND